MYIGLELEKGLEGEGLGSEVVETAWWVLLRILVKRLYTDLVGMFTMC